MIRVYKHNKAPESLADKKSWQGEDVVSQLKEDQKGKCYLCERIRITDYDVEHHKSKHHFPELTYVWSNLFWSCRYCNLKKSASFDDLVNPINDNVEEIIYQSLDFPNAKAEFSATGTVSPQITNTITLLNKIFNGSGRIRTIREQQFYDYVMSKITSFQKMTTTWLENTSEEAEKAIIDELDIKSEFLGFKYWIIRSNAVLLSRFEKYMIWHRAL